MAVTTERWMAQGLPLALSLEIQANLGGKVTTDLSAGNHRVTVPDEVQCVRHVLTGALTANRKYIFPAISGFFFVDNQTTGGKTVTLSVVDGGSVGTASGQSLIVFVDAMALTIEIVGASGGGGSGGVTVSVAHADSPYSVPPGVGFVSADSSGGNVTVELPAAADNLSRSIGVVRTSDTGTVTVTSLGGDIGGFATYPMNGGPGTRGNSILPNSDGVDWWIY